MPKRGKSRRITQVVHLHGFGQRIRQAILDHASQIGAPYSQTRFGVDVGAVERGEPYGSSTVSDWIAERNEPSLSTFKAMGKVTGKSPAWLMAIDTIPATEPVDARLSDEEVAELEQEAEGTRLPEKAKRRR